VWIRHIDWTGSIDCFGRIGGSAPGTGWPECPSMSWTETSTNRMPTVHHNDVDQTSAEKCTRVHGTDSIELAPQARHRRRTQVRRPVDTAGR
jgi:hypothetical protein